MARRSKTSDNAALAKREATKNASLAKTMTKVATVATTKLETVTKRIKEQNSVEQTLTVDAASAVIAHGSSELIAFGARALSDWSNREKGTEGHFAKHVGLYSSAPQSVIGFLVYVIELSTRGKRQMNLGLGRQIASRASNLLANLGLANALRALRYHLAQSVDESDEAEAERAKLLHKITALTKENEALKGGAK